MQGSFRGLNFYLNEIAVEKPVNEVQQDVLSVLRVTLNAHKMVSIPEHFNSSFV